MTLLAPATGHGGQETASSRAQVLDLALGPATHVRWPGADAVAAVDVAGALGGDLSDLFVEPGVMWAVDNHEGALVTLVPDGERWIAASTRVLRYPGGGGHPDSEGVTRAEPMSTAVYVAAERDSDDGRASRLSILRYDAAASGGELVATHEWDLTPDLPPVSPNRGLEAIRWIPDRALVAGGFFDENAGGAYAPSAYPAHGTGIFLVGVEGTGMIHAYALDHATGARHLLASFASGLPHVMAIEVDRDTDEVWVHCDSACGNRTTVLALRSGRFTVLREVAAPATMPSGVDNEGIALEPAAACVDGQRRFYWCDETAYGEHVLRADLVPCAH